MTSFKDGTSQGSSMRPGSAARDILKRRDRRYKTEQKRVFERRKKLDLHTSYAKPPDGYAFVPVGTPELANRCKDLSRQQAYPVHVVNAKPINKHALNTAKVSHHIHRIGYHFRGEIVERACEELGFVPHAGKYVKPEDLLKRRQESLVSQTLTKYGINVTLSSQARETLDQVRAAIKELFPRIPEQDLHSIVKHAWEEGTDRVGTNAELELPRRVQLAVIARIRHHYTDYDRLLRAFEWSEARQMVEPECLQKIIEWRGENDDDDNDQELEEIVRETIVIDDDEDNEMAGYGGEADDEDSVEIVDLSDTSIEITHQIAADDDLGAESVDERSRAFHSRFMPERRTLAQRSDIAKEKISAARKRIKDGFPLRTYPPPPDGRPQQHLQSQPLKPQSQHDFNEATALTVAPPYSRSQQLIECPPPTPQYYQQYRRDQSQDEVIIDGQRYRRAPLAAAPLPPVQAQPDFRYLPPVQTSSATAPLYRAYPDSPAPIPASRGTAKAAVVPHMSLARDRPVASIERSSDTNDFGVLEYEPQPPSRRFGPPPGAEVVDLTSPPRRPVYAVPMPQAQEPVVMYGRPSPLGRRVVYQQQPMPQPVHGAPAPIQYRVPGSWPESPARPPPPPPPPPPTNGAVAPTQYYYRS